MEKRVEVPKANPLAIQYVFCRTEVFKGDYSAVHGDIIEYDEVGQYSSNMM
ncbi:hypothetical protein [Caldanaerobius polysaccharolyticus]|uniref:hypothetical protein n=1 Tax=Caldanaerobius polysaccharolyticus TaxID=44256 RepID=UPI0012EC3EF6|nr:hypothetical protein [Caldanaerobius polysaccharolyticus]